MPRTLCVFVLLSFCLYNGIASRPAPDGVIRRLTSTAETALNLNPALSGDGRTVVFESSADLANAGGPPSFRVIRARSDGSFAQLSATRSAHLSVSQDGTRIVFAVADDPVGRNRDRNSEVFLFDGARLEQITHTLASDISRRTQDGCFAPSISDDGRFIVFAANRDLVGRNPDENFEIFLYDAATRALSQLTETSGILGAVEPHLSGDGTRVVYVREADGRDLMLRDLASGEEQVIAQRVEGLALARGRIVSDDGQRVVYETTAVSNRQLLLFDGRNGLVRQITPRGTRSADVPFNATISGDGSRIAFASRSDLVGSNPDGSVELYVHDIPTRRTLQITDAPAEAMAEVLSSLNDDGTLVAFNFARLLSGPVSDAALANNSEIYTATLPARPPFSTDATITSAPLLGSGPVNLLAPDSIAIATGNNFAFDALQAQRQPDGSFPLNLGGVTVTVNGRPAQLFYVSPTQVNFHVPAETEIGPAEIVVTNPDGFQTRVMANIIRTLPALFTDRSGEAIALDADTFLRSPFGPMTRRLAIFATGVRRAGSFAVLLNGRPAPIETLVPVPSLPGLDQINVALDARPAGPASVQITAEDQMSNRATLVFAGAKPGAIVINEVLFDPPDGALGDANRDGVRSGSDDEFIELVNASGDALDLSNWTIEVRAAGDARASVRHVFAAGTQIAAGDAIVVFGGGNFDARNPAFGGAQVFKASTGNLALSNNGATITVRDATGAAIDEFAYGTPQDDFAGSGINQSVTRSPDIAGAFVRHLSAQGAAGRRFSPGTRTDGSFFVARAANLASVSLEPPALALVEGQTAVLTARALDQYGRPFERASFAFASSDDAIATVTAVNVIGAEATATVRALRAGTAQLALTASDGATTITRAATVSVAPAPPRVTRLEIEPKQASVNRGNVRQFAARAFNERGEEITGVRFDWSTTDAEIATVNTQGEARGVGVGRVKVRVSAPDGMGGTISDEATLEVRLPLVINEILADVPPDDPATRNIEGDANRDGTRNSADDEFIELVNASSEPVDISNVTISDATATRFTFPANTRLDAGRAAVIFGGGAAPTNDPAFGGALIFTANSLGLNDGGDAVHVRLRVGGADVTVASQSYGSSGGPAAPSDQSLTRSPDASIDSAGGELTAHANAVNAQGRLFSPGTRADGTPFGSPPIARIEIIPASASARTGQSATFIARAFTVANGAERELANVSFIWSASDANRADLAPIAGPSTTATALAAGTVTIRARAGGQEAVATLMITPVVASVDLKPDAATVGIGNSVTFTATARDAQGREIPGIAFDFSLRDAQPAGVATVIAQTADTITVRADRAGSVNVVARYTRPDDGAVLEDSSALTVRAAGPAVPAPGQIVINEALVAFSSSTAETRNDFIELLNKTDQPLDISGLTITFRSSGAGNAPATVQLPGSVGSGTVIIGPRSYFLVVNGAETFGVVADYNAGAGNLDLNGTTGAIKIEIGGTKLDGFAYQGGSSPPAAPFNSYGEGAIFTFTSGATNDLIRSPDGTDTSDNARDFRRNGSTSNVSPKRANPTIP